MRWCFCGGVFVVVFLWWCSCGGVLAAVFLWWCFCGGVFVAVFLRRCFCGVVFLAVFLWWCSCGGVFVVVVFLWWCGGVFCAGVCVVVFVRWCFCGCFCGGVFAVVIFNRRQLCSGRQNKGLMNQGCHQSHSIGTCSVDLYLLHLFETSGTASCGTTGKFFFQRKFRLRNFRYANDIAVFSNSRVK